MSLRLQSIVVLRDVGFADMCAQQYHRLREYALGHSEAGEIMGAID